MGDLPGPGLEPVFPTLAGGFLTAASPGQSPTLFSYSIYLYLKFYPLSVYLLITCLPKSLKGHGLQGSQFTVVLIPSGNTLHCMDQRWRAWNPGLGPRPRASLGAAAPPPRALLCISISGSHGPAPVTQAESLLKTPGLSPGDPGSTQAPLQLPAPLPAPSLGVLGSGPNI